MDSLIYPTAAIVAYAAYKGYKSFEVPKEIQHIPEINFLTLLRSNLSGQSLDEQHEHIYKPVLEEYGYARMWVRGNWEIIVTDPKHGREILNNADVFLKRPRDENKINKRMLASGFFGSSNIIGTDGHEWRRHRRIANPAFKKTWSIDMFGDCTEELFEKFDQSNQEPIKVHSLFQRLTLDVLGRGLFSYDFEAVKKGESSRFLKVYNELMSAVFNPLYFVVPILEDLVPSRRYYHQKSAEFRGFLLEIIKERQEELNKGIEKNDLLSLMIKASMEESEEDKRLTDEEVLNDLVIFFLAGHDTTANTLTSTFYYLAKHPEIQEKARREVLSILGNNGSIVTPTSDQLKDMNYINCVIKESMRIITTVTQMRRYCSKTTQLSGGLTIPEDSFVIVNNWSMHHNSAIFPEPHKFNPDRFLDSHGPQDQTWMAFGSGSRMCVGLNFSLIEQRVAMAMLLQKYTIKLGPHCESQKKPIIKPSGLTHPLDIDLCFVPRH